MVIHGPVAISSAARFHPAILSVFHTVRKGRAVGKLLGTVAVCRGLASISNCELGGPLWALSLGGMPGLPERRARRKLSGTARSTSSGSGASNRGELTSLLVVINIATFALEFLTNDRITMWGAKVNSAINAGQWWRLITPVFLHANLVHLLSNNYSLKNLGPPVEMIGGRVRFLAIYFLSAVTGTLFSYKMSAAPSVGASGAIFGLGGALAVYFQRNRTVFGDRSDIVLQSLGQSLVANVAMSLFFPRIDNWGHLGGLVGGALVAYLLGPRYVYEERRMNFGKVQRVLVDKPPIPLFRTRPSDVNGIRDGTLTFCQGKGQYQRVLHPT